MNIQNRDDRDGKAQREEGAKTCGVTVSGCTTRSQETHLSLFLINNFTIFVSLPPHPTPMVAEVQLLSLQSPDPPWCRTAPEHPRMISVHWTLWLPHSSRTLVSAHMSHLLWPLMEGPASGCISSLLTASSLCYSCAPSPNYSGL